MAGAALIAGSDFNAEFADLSREFLGRCRRDRPRLQAALADASRRSDPNLARIVHQLAGAAGMLGFDELGRVAAAANASLAEGQGLSDAALCDLLAALRALGVS